MSLLHVEGLGKRFGGLVAVDGVSFDVAPGSVHAVIGPNGAGKTTLLNLLSGVYVPDTGRIVLDGRDLTGQPVHRYATGGLARTFQNLQIFFNMSALENVMAGRHRHENTAILPALLRLPKLRHAEERCRAEAAALMQRVGLAAWTNARADAMPYGALKRLEIARALATEPKLLLLDEPTAGVDPKARREFWDEIHRLAGDGLTVLVSTHYMDEAERCHRIGYIAYGRMLATGTVEEVVKGSGLVTYVVHGALKPAQIRVLEAADGVEQVAPFGAALHVVGTDRGKLEAALELLKSEAGIRVEPGETSLEDVFIKFMTGAQERAA